MKTENRASRIENSRFRYALVALYLLSSILHPLSASGANMRYAATNIFNTPDTNYVILQAIGDTINADGTFIPRGLPFRLYPNTNGIATTNLFKGNYSLTNAVLRQAILFAVPEDYTTNVYLMGQPGIVISGYNTYNYTPGINTLTGTNGFVVTMLARGQALLDGAAFAPTAAQITNALGFFPLSPDQVTNVATNAATNAFSAATNLLNTATNRAYTSTTNLVTQATNTILAVAEAYTDASIITATNRAYTSTTNLITTATNGLFAAGTNAAKAYTDSAIVTATNRAYTSTTNIVTTATNTIYNAGTNASKSYTDLSILSATNRAYASTTNIVTTATNNIFNSGTNAAKTYADAAIAAANVTSTNRAFSFTINLVTQATNDIYNAGTNAAKTYTDSSIVTATNRAYSSTTNLVTTATNTILASATNAAKTYADGVVLANVLPGIGLSATTNGNQKTLNVTGSVSATNALLKLNGLTGTNQTFSTTNTGGDFTITSSGTNHTFSIPDGTATNRGFLATNDFTNFTAKASSNYVDTSIVTATNRAYTSTTNLVTTATNTIYTASTNASKSYTDLSILSATNRAYSSTTNLLTIATNNTVAKTNGVAGSITLTNTTRVDFTNWTVVSSNQDLIIYAGSGGQFRLNNDDDIVNLFIDGDVHAGSTFYVSNFTGYPFFTAAGMANVSAANNTNFWTKNLTNANSLVTSNATITNILTVLGRAIVPHSTATNDAADVASLSSISNSLYSLLSTWNYATNYNARISNSATILGSIYNGAANGNDSGPCLIFNGNTNVGFHYRGIGTNQLIVDFGSPSWAWDTNYNFFPLNTAGTLGRSDHLLSNGWFAAGSDTLPSLRIGANTNGLSASATTLRFNINGVAGNKTWILDNQGRLSAPGTISASDPQFNTDLVTLGYATNKFPATNIASVKGDLVVWNGTNWVIQPAGPDGYIQAANAASPTGYSSVPNTPTAAGGDMQVQYNATGSQSAAPAFRWDYTTGSLVLGRTNVATVNQMLFKRGNATPNSLIGQVGFRATNSLGAEVEYASLRAFVSGATASSEAGTISLYAANAGTTTERLRVTGTNVFAFGSVSVTNNGAQLTLFTNRIQWPSGTHLTEVAGDGLTYDASFHVSSAFSTDNNLINTDGDGNLSIAGTGKINFNGDNAPVYMYAADLSDLIVGFSDTADEYVFTETEIRPVQDESVNLGSGSFRWQLGYFSGEVQAGNALNTNGLITLSQATNAYAVTPDYLTNSLASWTNGGRIASCETLIKFITAATGTASARIDTGHSSLRISPDSLIAAGTITNLYTIPNIAPGAIVTVTDVSTGTGASISVLTNVISAPKFQ